MNIYFLIIRVYSQTYLEKLHITHKVLFGIYQIKERNYYSLQIVLEFPPHSKQAIMEDLIKLNCWMI